MSIRPIRRKAWLVSPLERVVYVALLLSVDAAPPEPAASDTALQVVQVLEARDWPELRDNILSRTPWRRVSDRDFRERLAFIKKYGPVSEVMAIETSPLESHSRIIAERGDWELKIAIDEDGTITRFEANEYVPLVQSPPLALPVSGEWQALAGHVDQRARRRALHFGISDGEGNFHRGSGLDNRDYPAYGQPVSAMAAGQVAMVVDGVPDHAPDERDRSYLLGNVVIVQHRGDLYSVYSNLKLGSAKVKQGDWVQPGSILAECGNSGDSRVPHLQVHVQDGPIVDEAWGVEAIFADVIVERDGVHSRMTNVSLLEFDRVSPATAVID